MTSLLKVGLAGSQGYTAHCPHPLWELIFYNVSKSHLKVWFFVFVFHFSTKYNFKNCVHLKQ